MKQKITKGKVIQNCLKVTAAIVVAGGVGFQFHEIQGLEKDLNTLKDNHANTVQELTQTTNYAKGLESELATITTENEKLSNKVEKLKEDNESLKKENSSLSDKNNKLKETEKELNKKLIEARERPRPVSTVNSPHPETK